jgi:hypothetical protein
MGFLRRLFGKGPDDGAGRGAAATDGAATRPTEAEIEAEEQARELELLRAEQDRLGDLVRRQQRYADRSWVPPSQGGPRRAEDADREDAPER